MSAVRALVVDDSPTMRQVISEVLARDPGIEVIGTARSAFEAREKIKALNPDVMTLDVEMPDMDGISFLEKVMKLRPMPVVMVSTLTDAGSEKAITALAMGAIDCVVKPSMTNPNSFDELPSKVKSAARSRPSTREAAPPRPIAPGFKPNDKIVAIGSSTGGVEALITVLSSLPENCAPVVITQHMPPSFTRSLAARLDRLCRPAVVEASNGASLLAGKVYLAPGGDLHLEVVGKGPFTCRLRSGDAVNGHRPSVDVLFASVAQAAEDKAVGVILTGMGRDGAAGLGEMRRAGARTIGQNQESCVVYGMPRVAQELGAVEKQLPLEKIGAEIVQATALSN